MKFVTEEEQKRLAYDSVRGYWIKKITGREISPAEEDRVGKDLLQSLLEKGYVEVGTATLADCIKASEHQKQYLGELGFVLRLIKTVSEERNYPHRDSVESVAFTLDAIRLAFKQHFGSLENFVAWYADPRPENRSVSGNFDKDSFSELENLIRVYGTSQLEIPVRANITTWKAHLKDFCKFLFLDVKIEEEPSCRSQGVTKKELLVSVIEEMKSRGVKINVTGTVKELEERVSQNLNKPRTELQWQYWRTRYPYKVTIEKRTLLPQSVTTFTGCEELLRKFDELGHLSLEEKNAPLYDYFFDE